MPESATASPVATILAHHGSDLSETDVARALDEAFNDGLLRPAAALSASLPKGASDFLDVHGGMPTASEAATRTSRLSTVADMVGQISQALTTDQVAELLDVDPTRVRHRLRERALYTLSPKTGRSHRFPRWQFTGAETVPHLKAVLTVLPVDLHPLEVSGFFLTAQDTLELDSEPVSPRDWLVSGGDPGPVVELAAQVGIAI